MGWLRAIGRRLKNFLYNEDRSAASLGGAQPEETISSEAARHRSSNPVAGAACDVLDAIQSGHCQAALDHAEILDQADSKYQGAKQ